MRSRLELGPYNLALDATRRSVRLHAFDVALPTVFASAGSGNTLAIPGHRLTSGVGLSKTRCHGESVDALVSPAGAASLWGKRLFVSCVMLWDPTTIGTGAGACIAVGLGPLWDIAGTRGGDGVTNYNNAELRLRTDTSTWHLVTRFDGDGLGTEYDILGTGVPLVSTPYVCAVEYVPGVRVRAYVNGVLVAENTNPAQIPIAAPVGSDVRSGPEYYVFSGGNVLGSEIGIFESLYYERDMY